MVSGTKQPRVHMTEINGQRREVRQTLTASIYSRPQLIAALERLLMDPPQHESPDDLRDLDRRIGE